MDDILSVNGNNDYKIRHIGKNSLLQSGQLLTRIQATESALYVFNMFSHDNDRRTRIAAGEDNAVGDNGARLPLLMIQLEQCERANHATSLPCILAIEGCMVI